MDEDDNFRVLLYRVPDSLVNRAVHESAASEVAALCRAGEAAVHRTFTRSILRREWTPPGLAAALPSAPISSSITPAASAASSSAAAVCSKAESRDAISSRHPAPDHNHDCDLESDSDADSEDLNNHIPPADSPISSSSSSISQIGDSETIFIVNNPPQSPDFHSDPAPSPLTTGSSPHRESDSPPAAASPKKGTGSSSSINANKYSQSVTNTTDSSAATTTATKATTTSKTTAAKSSAKPDKPEKPAPESVSETSDSIPAPVSSDPVQRQSKEKQNKVGGGNTATGSDEQNCDSAGDEEKRSTLR